MGHRIVKLVDPNQQVVFKKLQSGSRVLYHHRSAVEVSLGARAHDMNAASAHPGGPTTGIWAQIWTPGALRGPSWPPKGPPLGALGVL